MSHTATNLNNFIFRKNTQRTGDITSECSLAESSLADFETNDLKC